MIKTILASLLALSASLSIAATAPVASLPSGVKVQELSPAKANAPKPMATSLVKVHYRGTLDDGKEFDSSYKRGEPATFPLNRVIPCWTEALQTMGVGEKALVTCPGNTAYGPQGMAGVIPPNATLHFEVELIQIVR